MKTTTNTQHTPGADQWAIQPNQADHGETTAIVDAKGDIVAIIPSAAWDDEASGLERDKANCRLIASAPDLLAIVRAFDAECARAAMNESKPRVSVLARLHAESRTAIAKAEGKA